MKVTVHVVVQAGDDTDAPMVVREVLSLDRDTLAPDTLRLASPRWWHCGCQPQASRTFSPLAAVLPTRVTPELQYLEARSTPFFTEQLVFTGEDTAIANLPLSVMGAFAELERA